LQSAQEALTWHQQGSVSETQHGDAVLQKRGEGAAEMEVLLLNTAE
jgi:hypothetical protein